MNLIDEVYACNPDVLLMDLTPDLNLGVLVELQRHIPSSRIVLWVRGMATELAYQAIEHGVRGILRKTQSPEILLKCLRMVADGGLWFEETLKTSFTSMRTVSLTRREGQLVSLLSQGLKKQGNRRHSLYLRGHCKGLPLPPVPQVGRQGPVRTGPVRLEEYARGRDGRGGSAAGFGAASEKRWQTVAMAALPGHGEAAGEGAGSGRSIGMMGRRDFPAAQREVGGGCSR